MASLKRFVPGRTPFTRLQLLRFVQANLAEYVKEEAGHVDITNLEQGWYMGALSEAIMRKVEIEEQLLQNSQEQEAITCKELEEEFLVTRTMSNREVMDDFENWIPAIQAEYTQLVQSKEAVHQLSKKALQAKAEKEGKVIELLPAKMVYTRKAGAGTRRARAVCCGNYSDTRFSPDCYAGGADGCQVRALIRTAALKSWSVAATDIRVAFLNAPRREDGKLVAMEIPQVYKRLGLAREGEVWLVKLAMYGLTTSPRDWSQYRDKTLPCISWVRMREDRKVRGYFVKTADENLWRLEETDVVSGECHWTGLMSVYVDDILLTGEEAAISSALTSLQSTWATSSVEWASSQDPVHFCGFEIKADGGGDGYHLSQQKYEQEIFVRWNVKESSTFPNFKIMEEDFGEKGEKDARLIREAQAMAGSLLWLSTRSRPDLAMGVASISRLMTKNPKKAIEVGQMLLSYVKGTPGDLHYTGKVHQLWGARGQLKIPRHGKLIEVFADIAYGTGSGHRSMQGLAIFFAGAPIAWQSSSQPFVTHSTAEAELVSYCEALTAGRATESLLCSMWGEKLEKNDTFDRVIYGDNAAAIALAHGNSTASWRTRHLRVRSNILKEALESDSAYPGGAWKLMHLKGTELVADGLTKPLLGQSFHNFLCDLGLRVGGASVRALGAAEHRPPQLQEQNNGEGRRQPQVQDQAGALRALAAGSMLVQLAEAQGEVEPESTFGLLWTCGIVLVIIGAIWVSKCACTSVRCCLRRLHAVISEPPDLLELSEDDEGTTPTSRRSKRGSSSSLAKQKARSSPVAEHEEASKETFSDGIRGRRRSRARSTEEPSSKQSPSCQRTRRQSGSSSRSSSRPMRRQSDFSSRSLSRSMRPSASSDASEITAAVSSAVGSVEKAAESAHVAAEAADRAAANAVRASRLVRQAMAKPKAAPPADPHPQNPWNRFQRDHAGRGWSMDRLRAEYFKAKCRKTLP